MPFPSVNYTATQGRHLGFMHDHTEKLVVEEHHVLAATENSLIPALSACLISAVPVTVSVDVLCSTCMRYFGFS